MIEYVVPENPDERILKRASGFLNEGKLICFPTDTNWIVACHPFVKKGIQALYRFKGASPLKHFSLISDTISRASEVALIDDSAFRLIRNKIPGNYTFIFPALKKITKAVQASKNDHQVGLRFVPSHLVTKLIEIHGEVLLSSQITDEMMGLEEGEEFYSMQIEERYYSQISLVIDPGELQFAGKSTIVNFAGVDTFSVERMGVGPWP